MRNRTLSQLKKDYISEFNSLSEQFQRCVDVYVKMEIEQRMENILTLVNCIDGVYHLQAADDWDAIETESEDEYGVF